MNKSQSHYPDAKSFYEVRDLKSNWRGDPSWCIEDTVGFEANRKELLAYRLNMEALWKDRNDLRRMKIIEAREPHVVLAP